MTAHPIERALRDMYDVAKFHELNTAVARELETSYGDVVAASERLANVERVVRPAPTGTQPLPVHAPALLAFHGDPQSGKDVVADHACATYAGTDRLAFSDAIIAEVNSSLDQFGVFIHDGIKNEEAVRLLLQSWGRMRRAFQLDYWVGPVNEAVQAKRAAGAQMIFITGMRDEVDYQGALALGAECWRIVRPDNPWQGASANPIERALDHRGDEEFALCLVNDGTLSDYIELADRALNMQLRLPGAQPGDNAIASSGNLNAYFRVLPERLERQRAALALRALADGGNIEIARPASDNDTRPSL